MGSLTPLGSGATLTIKESGGGTAKRRTFISTSKSAAIGRIAFGHADVKLRKGSFQRRSRAFPTSALPSKKLASSRTA